MSTQAGNLSDCIICSKQNGEFQVPGGAIYKDELIYASHALFAEGQSTAYLGWLVVETRRHMPGLADLTDAEAQTLGLLVARLSRSLKAQVGAEHVYAFVLGHQVPHLHIHLLPRYPGTPRQYWGMRVDEWPDAPQGGVREVETLCDQLRASLAESFMKINKGEVQLVNLMALRPNNWYINEAKLAGVRDAWQEGQQAVIPPVLVAEIDGELGLIDGHARAYVAFERGATHIRAFVDDLEQIEGTHALYEYIHRQGPRIGVETIADLGERIVLPDEYERLWVGYCTKWLEENLGKG